MKKRKIVKKRHAVYFYLARFIAKIAAKKHNFKYEKFKIKKGEQYFILSNHQTQLDPLLFCLSFNKPLYIVASDHIFNKTIPSKMMQHCFGPIKKKKATVDISFIADCLSVAKQGGSIAIYPEGNRAWADFQFYIDKAIIKLIRKLKMPVLLYNLTGGYGVNPRWGNGLRKGKFFGKVTRVISLEDMSAMTDDELFNAIKDGIKVIDSDSKEKYVSKHRAEYLESELFVCPVCKGVSTLKSHVHSITCEKCGLTVEYTEDLLLKSNEPKFTFNKLVDWYKFQLDFLKDLEIKENEVIYKDENIKFIDKTKLRRKNMGKGELQLTSETITLGKIEIAVKDVISISPVGGTKLIINTNDKSYLIEGHERFNPLKYVLTFNKLLDLKEKYYGLTI